jgi:hypothetical protein
VEVQRHLVGKVKTQKNNQLLLKSKKKLTSRQLRDGGPKRRFRVFAARSEVRRLRADEDAHNKSAAHQPESRTAATPHSAADDLALQDQVQEKGNDSQWR